jgi:hypothetical protein
MKNIKIKLSFIPAVALALALSTAFVSCDKETTDLLPFDRITEAAAFETPDRCELSVVGVYDAAQSGFYLGGQVRGYPFGAASVAQGDNRGEDMLNVALFYAITYESTYDPNTANNDYHWQTLYGLINRANIAIAGVQQAAKDGVISGAQANEYEGEARFLRALAHHELLVHFARPYNHTGDASHPGVPYRNFAVNTSAALEQARAQGRNTVKECYDLLIEDLNFAETNLPESRSGNLNITRATKGAAIALKTRVYLHKGDWANVIAEGGKLSGSYSLTPEPEGPFANYASNSESIFSIENDQTDNPGVNGALPVMYSVPPGRGLVAISPIIWNATWWLESDLRRTQLAKSTSSAYFSHKYRNITTQDDYTPLIRYAEVLLNMAEANLRLGSPDMAAALDLLNQVRNRALEDPADHFTMGDFANATAMLEAVLQERRIELLGEGRRWSDIHRLANDPNFSTGGIPAKVRYNNTTLATWGYGVDASAAITVQAIPYSDYRFLWPIPQSELNTNPVLTEQQNPGY